MELCNPLPHQLLDRMVHSVVSFVEDNLSDDVLRLIVLMVVLRCHWLIVGAATRSAHRLTHESLTVWPLNNIVELNSFALRLLLHNLEVRAELVVLAKRVNNHDEVVRAQLSPIEFFITHASLLIRAFLLQIVSMCSFAHGV